VLVDQHLVVAQPEHLEVLRGVRLGQVHAAPFVGGGGYPE
jgi:hypothetical protein